MSALPESVELAKKAAVAADEKLAEEIIAIDVSEHLVITDVFLVCSGKTDRQVHAIVDGIEEALLKEGVKPIRREGLTDAHWVLLDFGDIVVHVQQAEDRTFYALERLWSECPRIKLELPARSVESA